MKDFDWDVFRFALGLVSLVLLSALAGYGVATKQHKTIVMQKLDDINYVNGFYKGYFQRMSYVEHQKNLTTYEKGWKDGVIAYGQ